MMRSMTGFGKGVADFDTHRRISVEVGSVNRKQLELRLNMPSDWAALESVVRKAVGAHISRGAVQMRIALVNADGSGGGSSVNAPLLKALVGQCVEVRRACGLSGDVNVETLLSLPGVLAGEEVDSDSPTLQKALSTALECALNAFDSMREAEGAALKRDCAGRVESLKQLLAEIVPLVAGIPAMQKKHLLEKIAAEQLLPDPRDERLLKEVLFYADKADVTEEITRLNSHFEQFDRFLADSVPVGRSIDFLIQEMFREITTLGNKAAIPAVSPRIIAFKSELEKLREQIQNVE